MAAARIRIAAMVAAIMFFRSFGADAAHQMNLRVWPSVATAPATLLIYASIVQNEDNRRLRIVANSDDFSRSSEISLDGENSPKVLTFEYRELPSGSYDVRAYLIGRDGKTRDSVWVAVVIV